MKIVISLLILLGLTSAVVAEEKAALELPKSGRLAGSTRAGGGGTTYESDWGGLDPSGKQAPPISASVNRLNEREWAVKIFNNSEDQYKLQLKVVQKDGERQVKSDSVSVSLKGGEQIERRISSHGLAKDAEVNLLKWSKTEKKPTPEELKAEIEKKRAELEKLEGQLGGQSE